MVNKKYHLIAVFILILLGFFVYFNALEGSFVYDDVIVVRDNPGIRVLSNIQYLFSNKYFVISNEYSFRPIPTLTYILDYYFFQGNPRGFNLSNVIFHITSAVLLYFFLVLFLPAFLGKKFIYPTALLTSIFFIIHPIQTEVVNGIAFREGALYSLFSLLSLIFYLKAKLSKKTVFYLFSLLGYALAIFCKESAIILPFFIFLVDWFYCKGKAQKKEAVYSVKFRPYLGYAAVLGAAFFFRFFVLRAPETFLRTALRSEVILRGPGRPGGSIYTAILTTFRIFASYLRLLFFPLHLQAERVVLPSYSLSEPAVLLSLATLLFLLVYCLRNSAKKPLISFSVLWFFLALLPVTNIIPLYHAMADRYLYFPSIGFCLFLGVVSVKAFTFSKKPLKIILVFLLFLYMGFFSGITINRNKVWKDNFTFFYERVRHPPATERAYSGLGVTYLERGKLDKAEKYFKKSLEANPNYFSAYYNLGHLAERKESYSLAETYYKIALKLNPYEAWLYNSLADLYFKQGFFDKAEKRYKEALSLRPNLLESLTSLAAIYAGKGLYEEAEVYYKEVLELKPNNPGIHNSLGNIYLNKGLFDKAKTHYQKTLELEPRFVEAYNNLGAIYFKQGSFDKARKQWQKALEINPDFQSAKQNLRLLEQRE